MAQRGKSSRTANHAKWDRELTAWFLAEGITRCESCGTDQWLTKMHATKRRYVVTREDYFRAALVCWPEHLPYDEAKGPEPHKRMAAFVDGLIAKRKTVFREAA